jgi:hypothetical protein
MAIKSPAGRIPGTAGIPQITDIPARVSDQPFENILLFSNPDRPGQGRYWPDLTLKRPSRFSHEWDGRALHCAMLGLQP